MMLLLKSHPIRFPGAASPAQAKAGNYAKRKVSWRGLTISIENEAGSIRRGQSRTGHVWEQRMTFPYGYINRTNGVDGDQVDVFLGSNMDAPMVYVVHQRKYADWDAYDEDKAMVGFLSEDEARAAFLASYSDPRFLGPITAMPAAEFVEKAKATKDAPAVIKALIHGYTRKDGTFVKPHTDTRKLGRIIAISRRADLKLEGPGADAVTRFVGGEPDFYRKKNDGMGIMSERMLEDAFSESPSATGIETRKEVEAKFAPVREALRKEFGDTVTLYRGQREVKAGEKPRNVLSWTADEKVAMGFIADRRKYKVPSQADIDAAVERMTRSGFAKIMGRRYMLHKEDPAYVNIYDSHGEFITDGYTKDFKADLESERDDRASYNDKIDPGAKLASAEIPVDDIVWVTNRFNQREFIVRNRGAHALNPETEAPVAKAIPILVKSFVKGHPRRLPTGRIVYVIPHTDTRLKHQPDLFDNPHGIKHEPVPSKPAIIAQSPPAPPNAGSGGPDLSSYDKILVAFSGGKDSIAALLDILDKGVPREKIELHHHDIDGEGKNFMDWPITRAYCKAIAKALGIPIYFSWREGGFEREMMRKDERTASVQFEKPDGTIGQAGGVNGPLGTRLKFPQVSADLNTRWCSSKLKIDVMDAAIRNQDRFNGIRTLVVTGERAEESSNRAKYKTFEPHRSNLAKRHVDHYRPVHAWSEKDVWGIMQKHGVVPHPAYQLGWGRLSCRTCIFGSCNQWASVRALFPDGFEKIADKEKQFGVTIHRKDGVHQRADKGKPYESAVKQPELAKLADSTEWSGPVIVPPDQWKMPAGAFGEKDGPC